MNKNLKKVISTVAALAISASAVSAFAVNFPDVADDASYAQAVQELSALQIISGFEDGTFRPDELVTRAQITKMIVDALAETEQAEASKANTKFADVSADHWAKGYINQGVADEFIAGYSDTEFGPDDNVTYVQAQKMIVSAIGYETYAQNNGGWPNGYKQWAATTGITKGISGLQDDTQLTRAQVAQMLDNGMDAPICEIKDYTTQWNNVQTPNFEVKDGTGKEYQTLFTKKHDAYKVYGRVTATNKTSEGTVDTDKVTFRVEKADNFDDEYIKANNGDDFEDNMYFGDTNAVDLLLTYAQALIQIDDDDEYHIISITPAAASKSVALAAEDIDDGKSENGKLYFYPAGTTKNSQKYALADNFNVYVNGVQSDALTDNFDALVEYIVAHDTASVVLQKETNQGSSSSSTDYNLIQISEYDTYVVSDVQVKADTVTITPDNGGSIKIHLDDDTYTYSFKLDDQEIEAADIQEDDVLSIAYNKSGNINDSTYLDIIVSRDTAEGKCTTKSSGTPVEYTIGGTKYKIAVNTDKNNNSTPLVSANAIETSSEYTVYLDHFGRIAKVEELEGSKKYGILTNVYKRSGGDWYAKIIVSTGEEIEYKIDDTNAAAYQKYLKNAPATLDTAGVEYGTGATSKLASYPSQVVEYKVAASTNKLTINGGGVAEAQATATEEEYKVSTGTKIGSVRLGDSTVILDISEVNDDDEIRVVSVDSLTDGNEYSAQGYDRTSSGDRYYRFVLITEGTASYTADTQLAIFNGSELVDVDDDDRTAANLVVNGEEIQYVVKDDGAIEGIVNGLKEGDVIVFTTNSSNEISKIQIVSTAVSANETYGDFVTAAINKLTGAQGAKAIIENPTETDATGAAKTWNTLLKSAKSDDIDIKFGVVVDRNGSNFRLAEELYNGTVEESAGVWANYDTATELTASGAKVYTYDYSANNKKGNSRVFLDEGLYGTPDSSPAKETLSENGAAGKKGNDLLNITHPNIYNADDNNDIVFAIVRVDDDEVQEVYQIIYND